MLALIKSTTLSLHGSFNIIIRTESLIAEPRGSALQILKLATGHEPGPFLLGAQPQNPSHYDPY